MPTLTEARTARHAAQVAGARTYLGQACASGHIGVRYTSNRVCISCLAEARTSQPYNKAKGAAQKAAYRARLKARAVSKAALGADILASL